MPQFKLHVTPEFEQALEAPMHLPAPRRDFSQLQGLIGRYAGAGAKRLRPMAELERELDDGMERALRRTRRA